MSSSKAAVLFELGLYCPHIYKVIDMPLSVQVVHENCPSIFDVSSNELFRGKWRPALREWLKYVHEGE